MTDMVLHNNIHTLPGAVFEQSSIALHGRIGYLFRVAFLVHAAQVHTDRLTAQYVGCIYPMIMTFHSLRAPGLIHVGNVFAVDHNKVVPYAEIIRTLS